MTRVLIIGAKMLAAWVVFTTTIVASPATEDVNAIIVLKGVVKSKTEWGPPGFGETPKLDSKIVVFILKLQEPRTARQLSLPDDAADGHRRFAEVQLRCDSSLFPSCERSLKKSLGHRTTLCGQTERAAAPTDYLPVILRVRLIASR